jgi:hypothetical protein
MEPPRYRTLDGDEVALPLAMDRWVLVPRTLARFDPELAWTLDYEDAPEPERADPRLDFSSGALLVPIERWNDHAALEPNLAPCAVTAPLAATLETPPRRLTSTVAPTAASDHERGGFRGAAPRVFARAASAALASLAIVYVAAVALWLWGLRDHIGGPDVSTGLLLVGAAMLLAWLAGVAGAVPGVRSLASTNWRDPHERALSVCHQLREHPLVILRVGLVIQLAGFLTLVAIH